MDPTTPPPPSPPPQDPHTPSDAFIEPGTARNMNNFKSLMFHLAGRLLPANHQPLVERRFDEILSHELLVPDHPPYADMILTALWELKSEGGSSEEDVSNFIKKEYHELPWAHATILNNHLKNLCKQGKITMTHDRCYILGSSSTKPESSPGSSPSPVSSSYSSSSTSVYSSPSTSSSCSSLSWGVGVGGGGLNRRRTRNNGKRETGKKMVRVRTRGRGRGRGRGRSRSRSRSRSRNRIDVEDESEDTSLEVEDLNEVTSFEVEDQNEATSLEINDQNEATSLEIKDQNEATSLEVEDQNEITNLEVEVQNEVTSMEVKHHNKVTSLEVEDHNKFTSLEVEDHNKFTSLEVEDLNEVTSMEVEDQNKVTSLEVEDLNHVTSMEVEGHNKVASLEVEDTNKVASLEVENLNEVISMEVEDQNKVTSLDVEDHNKVTSLEVEDNNKVTSLEVENLNEVTSMEVEDQNKVTSLDVEVQNEVTSMEVKHHNKVTSLEVEDHNKVTSLEVEGSSFKDGNDLRDVSAKISEEENLSCEQNNKEKIRPQKRCNVTWIGRRVRRLKEDEVDIVNEPSDDEVTILETDVSNAKVVEHEHLERNRQVENQQCDIVEKQTLEEEQVTATSVEKQHDNTFVEQVETKEEPLHDDDVIEGTIDPQDQCAEKTEEPLQSCKQDALENAETESTKYEEHQTEADHKEIVSSNVQQEPLVEIVERQTETSKKDSLPENTTSSGSTTEGPRRTRQGLRSSSKTRIKTEEPLHSCKQDELENVETETTKHEERQTEADRKHIVSSNVQLVEIIELETEISNKDSLQENMTSSGSTTEGPRRTRQGLRSGSKKEDAAASSHSKTQRKLVTPVRRSLRSNKTSSEPAVISEAPENYNEQEVTYSGRTRASKRIPGTAEAEQVSSTRKTRRTGL